MNQAFVAGGCIAGVLALWVVGWWHGLFLKPPFRGVSTAKDAKDAKVAVGRTRLSFHDAKFLAHTEITCEMSEGDGKAPP